MISFFAVLRARNCSGLQDRNLFIAISLLGILRKFWVTTSEKNVVRFLKMPLIKLWIYKSIKTIIYTQGGFKNLPKWEKILGYDKLWKRWKIRPKRFHVPNKDSFTKYTWICIIHYSRSSMELNDPRSGCTMSDFIETIIQGQGK